MHLDREPYLRVEGVNDQHTLIHLLIRKGINYETQQPPEYYPCIKPAGDVDRLFRSMEPAIKFCKTRAVGFVFDADGSIEHRWRRVIAELRKVGLQPPESPPQGGYIEKLNEPDVSVGIWLMPDNSKNGALEDFLFELRDQEDALIRHAEEAVSKARREFGSKVQDKDVKKAELACWLAFQESPGMPYGLAMRSRYFLDCAPVAERFFKWFCDLYGIPIPEEGAVAG